MGPDNESRRNHPHSLAKEDEAEPQANILLWTLAFGLLVGCLGAIGGWAVSNQGALEMGLVGFLLGGIGGFLVAGFDQLPTNRYRSAFRGGRSMVNPWFLPLNYRYPPHETYYGSREEEDHENE